MGWGGLGGIPYGYIPILHTRYWILILSILLIINTSRPLYGGGSGVCVYFAYSFVICWSHLIVFGAHFVFLGATLGLLLGAFGAPWAPQGLSLASLCLPFGSLGTPWDHLGHLGLPSGAWGMTWGRTWTSFSKRMGLK